MIAHWVTAVAVLSGRSQQNRVKVLQPNGSSSVRLCWSTGAQPWSRDIFAPTVLHEMGWGECPKPGADGGLGTHQEKPCCQLQKRSSRCQMSGEGAGEGSCGRWNLSLKRQVSGEQEGDPMAGGTCLYLPGWGGATAQTDAMKNSNQSGNCASTSAPCLFCTIWLLSASLWAKAYLPCSLRMSARFP